ncbi:MAG: hypothetical protein IKN79_08045 [Eubacterium sp.]|nr:hypothetical protein [Eubacterium sp.]
MKELRIGICSRDDRYAASLAMALGRESGGEVKVTAVIRPESFSDMEALPPPDLWLAESPEEINGDVIPVVALTSRQDQEGVYKYQPVREILRELKRLGRGRSASVQHSGCIAVFSPLGRSGRTTLARAITAMEPSGAGLYIGMEDSGDQVVHSELLYQIKVRAPELWETAVQEIREEAGIACLRLSGMCSELRDVQQPDLQWFSHRLLDSGRYTTLVFDVGLGALAEISMLQVFDRIYLTVLPDPHSGHKLDVFRSLLLELGLSSLWQSMIPVEIPPDVTEPAEIIRYIE